MFHIPRYTLSYFHTVECFSIKHQTIHTWLYILLITSWTYIGCFWLRTCNNTYKYPFPKYAGDPDCLSVLTLIEHSYTHTIGCLWLWKCYCVKTLSGTPLLKEIGCPRLHRGVRPLDTSQIINCMCIGVSYVGMWMFHTMIAFWHSQAQYHPTHIPQHKLPGISTPLDTPAHIKADVSHHSNAPTYLRQCCINLNGCPTPF